MRGEHLGSAGPFGRRFLHVGFTFIPCVFILLLAVPPLYGQRLDGRGDIPTVIVPEPDVQQRERVQGMLPRGLKWEETRQALLAENLPAPPAAPTQFALTPREPYKDPGGYLQVDSPRWYPHWPDPTGHTLLEEGKSVRVALHGLKPNTLYLFDLFIDGYDGPLEVLGTCWWFNQHTFGKFDMTGDPQHVFVVRPTGSTGYTSICVRNASRAYVFFYKAEISELGPAP